MYTLVEINIYPIKSMGRISLVKSFAEERGLRFDRRMMLTDEAGNFLSQRKIPEMAKFSLSLGDEGFHVTYQDDLLFLPYDLKIRNMRKVRIWDDEIMAPEAEKKYSQWFSRHLNRSCRLMFMEEETIRKVDQNYAIQDETVSFSDGFPYLLTGTASLEDLNKRMQVTVPMDRFRSNLVISSDAPFIEDSFDIFKIGDAIFKRVKPCSRCIITTTDQKTGQRDREPLFTLSTYRKADNKIYFGQNLVCLRDGIIKVGDKLELNVNYPDTRP